MYRLGVQSVRTFFMVNKTSKEGNFNVGILRCFLCWGQ